MQVLQPKLELMELCDFASSVCTTSSRQSDHAEWNGPVMPRSPALNIASEAVETTSSVDPEGPVQRVKCHDTDLSAKHSCFAQHERQNWRYRPEHRFPSSFWQGAHDFLIGIAAAADED